MKMKCAICGISVEQIAENYSVSSKEAKNAFERHHISHYPEKFVYVCAICHRLVTYSETFRKKHEELFEEKAILVPRKYMWICLKCGKRFEEVTSRQTDEGVRVFCPECGSNEISIIRFKEK